MIYELKPCPFCGGEAEVIWSDYIYVECSECGGRTTWHVDRPEAVDAWNSRATSEQPDDE